MIADFLEQHAAAVGLLSSQQDELARIAGMLVDSLRAGGKVLLMGNGGSAADAQHIAAELVGRFQAERPALAALALTTDTSALTSIGNDYGFESIFARQVEGLARAGDVVIGISTSGNSANVVKAMEVARGAGCVTVALLGNDGVLATAVDAAIRVPGFPTARVQEVHILAGHILCELVEREFTA